MRSTRRTWLATIAASASLAGCIGDDGDGDSGDGDTGDGDADGGDTDGADSDGGNTAGGDTDGGDTDGGDTDGTDGGTDGPTLSTVEHDDLGDILADADGMVLYMFDPDPQGEGSSACTDDCAANWPPLTVEEGAPDTDAGVSAAVSTFERADGSTQVAANGWPLYYWQGDSEAGDATGQGVGGVWWVLRPDGTPVRPTVRVSEHDEYGQYLVDSEGMALYMFDSDTQGAGASTCSGGCASAWPPLVDDDPSSGGDVTADLTTFDREDGDAQVAANGWPLYYYAQDSEAGDVAGQGANDVWWLLDPSGEPIRPSESGDDGVDY